MEGIEIISQIGQMSPLLAIAAFSTYMFFKREKQYNELNRLYRGTLREVAELPPEEHHVNGDLS